MCARVCDVFCVPSTPVPCLPPPPPPCFLAPVYHSRAINQTPAYVCSRVSPISPHPTPSVGLSHTRGRQHTLPYTSLTLPQPSQTSHSSTPLSADMFYTGRANELARHHTHTHSDRGSTHRTRLHIYRPTPVLKNNYNNYNTYIL